MESGDNTGLSGERRAWKAKMCFSEVEKLMGQGDGRGQDLFLARDAEFSTSENNFLTLALRCKFPSWKQTNKCYLDRSQMSEILLCPHYSWYPSETWFPCLYLHSFVPPVMRPWSCCVLLTKPELLLSLSSFSQNPFSSFLASLDAWHFVPFRGSCATTCSYWQAELAKWIFLIGL